MIKRQGNNYNQRLFSGGLRGFFHQARFNWLSQSLGEAGGPQENVIELGCYDGKTIRYLPAKPRRYVGYDENWEGGLPLARELWAAEREYEFILCSSPADMTKDERFDVAVCMETLEHVPPELIEPYIARLGQLARKIFITVPTEKGPIFASKYLVKRLFGTYQEYTFAEFLYASAGMLDKVKRNDHKGFDYQIVIDAVRKHLRIVKITPYPLQSLPLPFGFGIGIVGESRSGPSERAG